MKLIEINKSRYRKHLNIIIVSFISSLLVLSLLFGSGLVALFTEKTVTLNVTEEAKGAMVSLDNKPALSVSDFDGTQSQSTHSKSTPSKSALSPSIASKNTPSKNIMPPNDVSSDEVSPNESTAQQTELPAVSSAENSGNFRYNLLGVILALLACAAGLYQLKHSQFFVEVYYVWQLKQLQNLVYRRLKKIKSAATGGDADAMLILSFYYASLKQVYLLDDNTLTITKLDRDIENLNEQIKANGLTLLVSQFDRALLAKF